MTKQNFGTCTIILNSAKTHVLLGKRKNAYGPGLYGLPGGRIEVGEEVEIAASREVTEETGLSNVVLKYLGVVKENQGNYDFVHFVFLCEKFQGEPSCQEPEKCESWEWLPLNQLKANILPGHLAAIQSFQAGQKNFLQSI